MKRLLWRLGECLLAKYWWSRCLQRPLLWRREKACCSLPLSFPMLLLPFLKCWDQGSNHLDLFVWEKEGPWLVRQGTQGGPGIYVAVVGERRVLEWFRCFNVSFSSWDGKVERVSWVLHLRTREVFSLPSSPALTESIYFASVSQRDQFSCTELIKVTKVMKVEQPLLQWV